MRPLQDSDPRQLGQYRLLARLGAGGMGRVYLAHSSTGRTVAVKVVRQDLSSDDEFRERFAREVEMARAVSSRWTVPVVDADTEAQTPWLATAYILGPTLGEALADHGPLPESSVRALGAGLAEALVGIHAAGLVHRDLKPGNVLLSPEGPRVIDFGIARAVDGTRITGTGVVVGSPGFMSPEQASGAATGPAGDVFALASVLANAATGRAPFGEGSAAGQLYQVVHGQPDLTGVPAALTHILAPCFAKDPARRPAPRDLAAVLCPQGATAALTGAWLPGPVTAAIARAAAQLVDLESPNRLPPGARGGDLGGHGSPGGWGPGAPTPADGVPGPSMAWSDGGPRDGTVLLSPGHEGVTSPGPASPSRRRLLAGVLAAAGTALVGGGAVLAYDLTGKTHANAGGGGRGAGAAGPSGGFSVKPSARPAGVAPEPVWSVRLTKPADATPLVVGQTVLVKTEDNAGSVGVATLTGLDLATGRQRWSDPGYGDLNDLTAFGTDVLAVNRDGGLVVVDAATGSPVRTVPPDPGHVFMSVLTVNASTAFVLGRQVSATPGTGGPAAYTLTAVRVADGARLWQQQTGTGDHALPSSAVADDQQVVLADHTHQLTARTVASGAVRWTAGLGESSDLAGNPPVDLTLASGVLLAARGRLTAWNPSTGTHLWSQGSLTADGGQDSYSPTALSADGTRAYCVHNGVGQLVASDVRSGQTRWTIDYPNPTYHRPVLAGGLILLGVTGQPVLVALKSADGGDEWQYRDSSDDSGNEWRLTAVPSAGVVLALTGSGVLAALPAD
ncbi:protein kinase domain-containing protein [Streptacidiphilus jiangxiensis]|uniref:PQQ-like domain-containing protein n=1 Tax=Streptacidiphilus jiangxiensis TaxID=235985 RepID=A0A1H7R0M9_STRJI|nr:serine/threonine-protein kinase [Streptacidiphilus jiangxiensis]SEL53484.1 PQQ-like domain-containing protein [Streptacidiphilus jiangxiensis]